MAGCHIHDEAPEIYQLNDFTRVHWAAEYQGREGCRGDKRACGPTGLAKLDQERTLRTEVVSARRRILDQH